MMQKISNIGSLALKLVEAYLWNSFVRFLKCFEKKKRDGNTWNIIFHLRNQSCSLLEWFGTKSMTIRRPLSCAKQRYIKVKGEVQGLTSSVTIVQISHVWTEKTNQPTDKMILREGCWNTFLLLHIQSASLYWNAPWQRPRGGQSLGGCQRWDQCQRMRRCRTQNLPTFLDFPKYKLVGLRLMRDEPKKKKGRWDLPWATCRLGRARMFQHQDSPVAIHIRSDLYQFWTNYSLMIKVGHLKTWYKHCVLLKLKDKRYDVQDMMYMPGNRALKLSPSGLQCRPHQSPV